MAGKNEQNELRMLIESSIPLIAIETHEEKRATELLKNLTKPLSKWLFSWSITQGLKRIDLLNSLDALPNTETPEAVLKHISIYENPAVFILYDFHPWLDDAPQIIRKLREIALGYHKFKHTIILISHSLKLPSELKPITANFDMQLPNKEQLENLIREEANLWSKNNQNQKVKTDRKTLNILISNLRGLTFHDARTLIKNLIYDDGAITESELPEVNQAKFKLLEQGGVLTFEFETAKFSEVGGLNNLKTWLSQRQAVFHRLPGTEGLDRPKGMMLVGVQGGGKSLAAKAVAGMWGVPLLRLDFGSLYNKFHGETEKNLRQSLKLAEVMSPCILWMDEIEKGLSSGEHDGGTSQRVLGTLLTWMAENEKPVFIVSTSNDINRLPPELIRKGRLDEIFFVDLPSLETRKEIFNIHLEKRKQLPKNFDLSILAEKSDGFSGAEIEQAVVAGLYTALAQSTQLSTEIL
ncbi:MAG: AAA family ATPase, partial [Gammaproteobacteria bacterium]|nr:AAA family ATPase [Gammaproteobacteria bacterium]